MIILSRSRHIWEDILFFVNNQFLQFLQIVINLTTKVGRGIKNSSKIRGANDEW